MMEMNSCWDRWPLFTRFFILEYLCESSSVKCKGAKAPSGCQLHSLSNIEISNAERWDKRPKFFNWRIAGDARLPWRLELSCPRYREQPSKFDIEMP